MEIAYQDGSEKEILDILRSSEDLSSSSVISPERHVDWAIRYHLCPERSNLLRHLNFAGLDVLELGAGMGAASRFICENAHSYVAVEGTEGRLAALKERLRDLTNWRATASNIEDFHTDERFDVVCLIGVLEYAELYIHPNDGSSPFDWLLRHAASMLKPGGQLVVAIENRNGLKYWAGAPEDHTSRMYDGICGYASPGSPRTFSRKKLLSICEEAGLSNIEEFYPWPDYKTPTSVVSKQFTDRFPFLAAEIAGDAMTREPMRTNRYFPETLAVYEAARSGLLPDLANSFLLLAGTPGVSTTRDKLLGLMTGNCEGAWHYSVNRKIPARTAFVMNGSDTPTIDKRALREPVENADSAYASVVWKPAARKAALLEPAVVHSLRRLAYAGDAAGFRDELVRYLRWACAKWQADADHLQPVAFDANPANSVFSQDGYNTFDLEWKLREPLPKSWFILRNLCSVDDALSMFAKPLYENGAALYEDLCGVLGVEPDIETDIEREARVQADIHKSFTVEEVSAGLHDRFVGPRAPALYPRDPVVEVRLREAIVNHKGVWSSVKFAILANPRLRKHLERRSVQFLRRCLSGIHKSSIRRRHLVA